MVGVGVYGYFIAWRASGLFVSINHHLVMLDRERAGREASPPLASPTGFACRSLKPASPSAAVLDSQGVKTTVSGGPWGYDAGRKVKGRKRQALVDTDGRALVLDPQPADVQDRDGPCRCSNSRAGPIRSSPRPSPMRAMPATSPPATLIAVEIVCRPPGQVGFVVHPRRWVVERFFAWISRNRRLWKDPETTIASAQAFLYAFRDANSGYRISGDIVGWGTENGERPEAIEGDRAAWRAWKARFKLVSLASYHTRSGGYRGCPSSLTYSAGTISSSMVRCL